MASAIEIRMCGIEAREKSGYRSVLKGELQDLRVDKRRVPEKEESEMLPEQQEGRRSHCRK